MSLINYFIELSKTNMVLAGLLGAWTLGVFTFFLKEVPLRVLRFVVNQTTTELLLNSQDAIYHDFLDWVSRNHFNSFVRNLNFNSGRRGFGDNTLAVGFGTTFFRFKHSFFLLSRTELTTENEYVKEKIRVTCFGRSHSVFKQLFEEINAKNDDNKEYVKTYRWENNAWMFTGRQFKRNINTVVLQDVVKRNILSHVNNFLEKRPWYVEHGIPYKTGILLYGPPGTGKSSLIKALASNYNRDIYMLSLSSISDSALTSALAQVPENEVVAIEDIDAYNMNLNRTDDKGIIPGSLTLSGILNAIDGAVSSEGRILIATTNNIDKLDNALIREGRFDLKSHVSYMDNDTLSVYMRRFYPGFALPLGFQLKAGVAPCTVQQLVFRNPNDPGAVLTQVKRPVVFNQAVGRPNDHSR